MKERPIRKKQNRTQTIRSQREMWKPGNMLYPVPAVMVSCGRPGGKTQYHYRGMGWNYLLGSAYAVHIRQKRAVLLRADSGQR